MMGKIFQTILGVTTAIGTLYAAPAFAQAGNDDGGQSDIIVTARRVEERLQDVPISITVYNQTQLTNRNVVTAGDLATYTPSLSSNSLFGSTNTSFAIRGFVQDFGTQPAVGVYFADVVSPRSASNNIPAGDGAGPGSFFDLANVQVLKGPQGTLFGRNTTGGAVLLVPQKPTGQFGGYVEGSIGNYDMRRIQAVVNIPVMDTLRIRLGVDRQTRDGYLTNTGGIGPSNFNDVAYTAARASIVADLTPNLENYTIISYMKSDTNGDVGRLYTAGAPSTSFPLAGLAVAQLALANARGDGFYTVQTSVPNARTKLEQWQLINTTTWKVSDQLTIKNIASYAQFREDLINPLFGTQFDASNLDPRLPAGTYVNFTGAVPIQGGHSANQSTATEEIQFQYGSADGRLIAQAGAYLESSQPLGTAGSFATNFINCTDVANRLCSNPLGFGGATTTFGRTSFRNVGVYSQATYSITDQIKLTGGLRYTWDRARNTSQLQQYLYAQSLTPTAPIALTCQQPDAVAPNCTSSNEAKSDKPTWLIGLDFKPADDVLLYAKYVRGYRAGGITPGVPSEFVVFQPEKVDTYEVGAKTSFRGAVRGTFNIAGFYNDFSSQQLIANFAPRSPASGLPSQSGIVNAGQSRIWGVEVEGSISPFHGLNIDVGYTYLNTKLLSVTPFATAPSNPFMSVSTQRPGDPIAFSPKNKVTVTGSYTLPLDASVGKITFGATFTHSDRQLNGYYVRDAAGTLTGASYLDARDLLNLNASWDSIGGSNVDLGLFATNVTKQKYYTYISGLVVSQGFDTAQIGQPRMYGARVKYRF